MAKQNSATDPVSAAMSAIESALNLTDDDLLAAPSKEPAPQNSAGFARKVRDRHPGPQAERASRGRGPASPSERRFAVRSGSETCHRRLASSQRRPRDGRRHPAGLECPAPQPRAVCSGFTGFGRLGGNMRPLCLPELAASATVAGELERALVAAGDAPPGSRDARPHLLHVRLRGARPPPSRTAPVGACDLPGSSAARGTRDHRRRSRRDPLAGDPPRADVDGRRRGAGAGAGCGARDTRQGGGFDA